MFLHFIKKQRRRERNKIFIFSILSAFISTVAAVLLTPKSGKDMRVAAINSAKVASEKTVALSNLVSDKLGQTGREVEKQLSKNSANIGHLANAVKLRATQTGENLISKLKDKAADVEEAVKSDDTDNNQSDKSSKVD